MTPTDTFRPVPTDYWTVERDHDEIVNVGFGSRINFTQQDKVLAARRARLLTQTQETRTR
jgi:hypothetical protein